MGKAVTDCSRGWIGEGQGREQRLDFLLKSRGSRDVSWICSGRAQRGLWKSERMEDGVEWLRSRGTCQGRWGESWSTDEAFEPKALGLKVPEEEANSAPGRGSGQGCAGE